MCDKDVIQTDDIITYGFFVKGTFREYSKTVNSKRWEPTDSKKNYRDETLLIMASNVEIESPVNMTVEKFYCKNRHKGKDNKYGL